MDRKDTRLLKRQRLAYTWGRRLALWYFTWRFNALADVEPKVGGPMVVVCNHVTELDFFFVAKVFKTPLSFVVGRGLLQSPLLGWLLKDVFGVIPKQKGSADPGTTLTMLRRLRQGNSVCLFAEGNTTFNGKTGSFPPATGGLMKAVGATLVTLRIEGAYFALPRWGRGIRRGRTAIRVAGVYPKEQLSVMAPEDINSLMARDLFEDAHARQEKEQVAYSGKNTAQGLEHALYLCPECLKLNTLAGRGDELGCGACQTTARFTPQGRLEGGFRLHTIQAWADWQRAQLKQNLESGNARGLPRDENHTLLLQKEDETLQETASGPMMMDGQSLRIGGFETPLLDIRGFEIYRKNILQFTLKDGKHYQTGAKPGFNALKYRDLYELCQERRG